MSKSIKIGKYAIQQLLQNLQFVDVNEEISNIKLIKLFKKDDIPESRFQFTFRDGSAEHVLEFPAEYFSQILVDNNWLEENEFIIDARYLVYTDFLSLYVEPLETTIRIKGKLEENSSFETKLELTELGILIDEKITKGVQLDNPKDIRM